jgi:flagellar basal body L-ring protein FlgH
MTPGHHERARSIASQPQDIEAMENAERGVQSAEGEAQAGEAQAGDQYANSPMYSSAKKMYKNGVRATRADFIDESPSEGSLWASDGQTNYYFTKNKVRGIGDIVSVKVSPPLIKDVGTEVRKTLTPFEKQIELQKAQERLRAKALGIATDAGATPNQAGQVADATANAANAAASRAPAAAGAAAQKAVDDKDVEVPEATMADIDVAKSLEMKDGDTILAEIIERYPNGNYKLRGTKRVPYLNGYKTLTMVGIAKASDISEDDVVNAEKLYEYRLQVAR